MSNEACRASHLDACHFLGLHPGKWIKTHLLTFVTKGDHIYVFWNSTLFTNSSWNSEEGGSTEGGSYLEKKKLVPASVPAYLIAKQRPGRCVRD